MLSSFLKLRPCAHLNAVRFVAKQKKAADPAKKVKLLGDVMFENEATLSEESLLLARTNSSTLLKRIFNPFVLRTYGELKQEKAHPTLHAYLSTTEYILNNMNKDANLGSGGQLYKHSSNSTSISRRRIASCFSETLQNIKSDQDQQYVASVLAMTMPESEKMWREYDEGITNLLSTDNMCSIDTGLLVSHALASTGPELKLRPNWKTPKALVNLIVRRRNQLIEENIKANVFDFAMESDQLADKEVTLPGNNIEMFSQIGESKTRESKDLERLGLIMQLLASPVFKASNSTKERADFNTIALEATEYGVKVFSTLKHPAPISALKVVWTHASKCELPNSYLFYKSVFAQVLHSITADPLQLVGEEEAVDSLLKSMVASKFKSSALITKLFEILSQRGFDYHKIGLQMFGSLAELNATSFASSVLNSWVESSEIRYDAILDNAKEALYIGDKAITMVCEVLAKKETYSYGDLAIVVTNCGRVGHKNATHLQLLRDIEAKMTPEIANFPMEKVIALLRVYATTGRNYSPIIEQLCEKVNQNVSTMGVPALGSVLWCAARLNLRNASYVDAALSITQDNVLQTSELNASSASELIRFLWTLSVLRKLDLETFSAGMGLIEQYVSSSPEGLKHSLNHSAVAQLSQAWVEAKTLLRERDIDEEDWLLENATAIVMSPRGAACAVDKKVQALPWHSGEISISERDLITSSYTHMDLSKTFTKMKVPHENEYLLDNGYVADVFIPIQELEEMPHDENPNVGEQGEQEHDEYEVPFEECKGVVVEYDGPFHFESYRREELGTTLMKRRHIKSAGYKMVNLPFWRYTVDGMLDKREQIVKTYLQKMGLRVKQK